MSNRNRLFVGRVNPNSEARDLKKWFEDHGFRDISDVTMKRGYAFVEFKSSRDAEDAVHDLDRKEFFGSRLTIEHAKSDPYSGGGRGGRSRSRSPPGRRYGGGGGGYSRDRPARNRPHNTEYRIIVENLSSRVEWSDLKDLFRGAGEVAFTSCNRDKIGEGIVEFESRSGLKAALKKYRDYEFFGKKMHLVDDSPKDHSRSRSRSGSRSRSRSKSRSKSRSRSASRSRSKSRSRSPSKSRSPAKNDD